MQNTLVCQGDYYLYFGWMCGPAIGRTANLEKEGVDLDSGILSPHIQQLPAIWTLGLGQSVLCALQKKLMATLDQA